ncbi:hypothetical protein BJY52DRAFT_1221136 [Lactarius psammicola]|nr:hypothetical protein BJY52DRAFT_1221136 [Lactarius psammicola]
MSNHLENPRFAGTPAGGSSAYPSEPIPQTFPWRAPPHPYPVGFPATANPDLTYVTHNEPRFVAPGDTTYRADATPLYPWRVDSEVVEVRKETCGPNRSRVTVVFETPDEI